MKLGMLFAGQGSQTVGMGKDFYETYEKFRSVFDLLPEEQRQIAFEGPDDALKSTVNTQPIMLAFALGVYRVLEENGVRPVMAAGLSLGEYSALAAAGVFTDSEAIDIISFRAKEMAKASEGTNTVMSAVMGLGREEVEAACRKANENGKVEIANYNCPGQIVVSGTEEGVASCEELAGGAGARRCMRLAVSGPFHTSYMEPAGEALREKFKDTRFGEPDFPILFNAIGGVLPAGETIADMLVKQVSHSVYFEDTIKKMEESGIDTVIEIGPGKALSGFVKKTSKNIRAMNIDTVSDLEKVLSEVSA